MNGLMLALVVAFPPAPFTRPDDSFRSRQLQRLERERDERLAELERMREEFTYGRVDFAQVLNAARRVLQADLRMADRPPQRLAAHARYLEVVVIEAHLVKVRWEAG